MFQLEIFRDRSLVATQPLRSGDLTIGRDPTCDIVLDDPLVSRQHARLHVGDGEFVLEDVSHKNGIVLRERKVERVVLHHGTTVRLGGHHLRLCLGGIGLPSTCCAEAPVVPADGPTVVLPAHTPPTSPSWSLRDPCLAWKERGAERIVVLDAHRRTLGPGRDADVVLPLCGPPSPPLAAVEARRGRFALTRLGPRGSVQVNDRAVDHRMLADGDLVSVGIQVIAFHCRG